jgi:hypothetical protein
MRNFIRSVALTLLAIAVAAPGAVCAQSSPGWPYGHVPTAGMWNQAFSMKQDALGFRPLNRTGDTMTGKLWLMPSNTFNAGLNCGVGNAPTTPQNGDIWCTSAGMFNQIGGVTVGPFAPSSVTSVAMTAPDIFTIAGSPITTNGTLALTLATQNANKVFAGPATGADAAPTFRALVAADFPFGTGVASAAALGLNAAGGIAGVYNASIATGDCLKWGPGVQDAGAACGGGGGGGGNVSNAGTPANTQLAEWTGATTIQGVAVPTGFWTAMAAALNATGGFVTNVATALGYTPASLSTADQTLSGGANLTVHGYSAGNITVDCGLGPGQYVPNTGPFTITAPASDGACDVQIENGSGAGAVTWSGFSEGANTGDPLDTTSGHKFLIGVTRIHGTSHYLSSSLQ